MTTHIMRDLRTLCGASFESFEGDAIGYRSPHFERLLPMVTCTKCLEIAKSDKSAKLASKGGTKVVQDSSGS